MTASHPLVGQGLAIGLGAVSGLIASFTGLPLPWLLGAMIGTTIAAMFGAPIRGPNRLRPFFIPVIGVMLGSGVTSDILQRMLEFWPALVLLVPFLVFSAAASFLVYRYLGRFDPITAFFCAMPGGLNDMMMLGGEAGGNARKIALAHATRILVVITFVVLFYGLVLGVDSTTTGGRFVPLSLLTASDWFILGACAVIGAPLATKLDLPAAQILGPMILSGVAHGAGLVHVAPPTILIVVAQIVVGTVIGCRFLGATVQEIGREVLLGGGSSLVMIGVAIVFAGLLVGMTGDPLDLSFLALSPGGLTEMSLLALAMGQDVIYVTTIHIIRISIVIALAAPAFRLIRRIWR